MSAEVVVIDPGPVNPPTKEEFVERCESFRKNNDSEGLFEFLDEFKNPENSSNLQCDICFMNKIKPNEIGFDFGNWKCSIKECGILTCYRCLETTRKLKYNDVETNYGPMGDGTIGKKFRCTHCRNYDWKYTMSSLLQREIPIKALERTMTKEAAEKKWCEDWYSKYHEI